MARDLEFDIRGRDKTGPAFDSATSRARAFDAAINATAKGFAVLETASKAFVAGIGIGVIEEFGSAVRDAITNAADMVDLADKVSISTDDLQRMKYGFEVAGVAAEDLDKILEQWSRRIGEAYTNGGRLAEILKLNGVALTDAGGNLRSAVDLMRDYADLVGNAASDQERMVLATEAFGKSGDAMVLALREGADGMNELMRLTDETGGIIEKELLLRAAELDDKFNALAQTIEARVQRGLLGMAATVDSIISKMMGFDPTKASGFALDEKLKDIGLQRVDIENEILRLRSEGEKLSQNAIDLGFKPDEDPRVQQLQERESALRAEEKAILDVMTVRRAEYEAEVESKKKQDEILSKRPTIIPGAGEGGVNTRKASAKAAREQVSAYDRLIERLQDEYKMLGMSDTAQRVLIEQRRAGVEATSEQGQAIAALVEKIETEGKALEAAKDAADFMNDNLRQSFMDLLPQIETGNQALDGFINRLIEAAAEAAFFGSGPLSGLFGGGGLFSGLGGGAAAIADPWAGMRVPSFDGGGSTGSGSRSGGMDGKGGFLAMLHPNETVTDHTKGGSSAEQGGVSVIRLELSESLKAEILQQAGKNSVEITRAGLTEFSRGEGRDMVQKVLDDPRARG